MLTFFSSPIGSARHHFLPLKNIFFIFLFCLLVWNLPPILQVNVILCLKRRKDHLPARGILIRLLLFVPTYCRKLEHYIWPVRNFTFKLILKNIFLLIKIEWFPYGRILDISWKYEIYEIVDQSKHIYHLIELL